MIIVGIGIWVWWAGGIYKAGLSFKYWIPPDKIFVDAEPHDCDYNRAPLGDKGCHYAPVVVAENGFGRFGGNTGRPMITSGIEKLFVSWVKVTD